MANKYATTSKVTVARTCGRKVKYASQGLADEERAKRDDPGGSSYLCGYCGAWHISKRALIGSSFAR